MSLTPSSTPSLLRQPFDPESVPHDPGFEDPLIRGAAIAPERLRPGELRRRFAAQRSWEPEIRADPRFLQPADPVRPAAVLIPLIVRADQVFVLLTERTAHLNDHAGQISFPGGRVEQGDVDAVATALREAQEEIGLGAALVDVVATLPEYTTATGYLVTPVIGMIEQPFEMTLDRFEVSEAFTVPLAFLMDPARHERRLVQMGASSRSFYAMPYQAQRRFFIWGATASMLRNLYHYLSA